MQPRCLPLPGRPGPRRPQGTEPPYIAENPHPEGERYKLDAVDDNSYYARDHRAFHDWAKRFREHFGYYDVFLISPAGDSSTPSPRRATSPPI